MSCHTGSIKAPAKWKTFKTQFLSRNLGLQWKVKSLFASHLICWKHFDMKFVNDISLRYMRNQIIEDSSFLNGHFVDIRRVTRHDYLENDILNLINFLSYAFLISSIHRSARLALRMLRRRLYRQEEWLHQWQLQSSFCSPT